MDFSIDKATRNRVALIASLGRDSLRPLGVEADRLGRPIPADHEFFTTLVELGQGRTRWRPGGDAPGSSKSGRETGATSAMICVAEEMSYWDRGVAVAMPGPGMGEAAIMSMGSEEQKQRFLGPFVEPDRPRWGSFAMTEPGAGSDTSSISSSCRRDGEDWVLNGAKMFIGNASRADWILVWATVDREKGRTGHRAFVVEKGTPGLGNFKIEKKMGLKAYESTSFTLDDCRLPAANLLGGEQYYDQPEGSRGALRTFNAMRPIVAAMAVGMGRAARDEVLAFARDNGLLGRVRVRDRIERIDRQLAAARLMSWKAGWLADNQLPNIVEASMAKALAPAVALEAASLGMELLGETGARGDHLVEKLFRDVKAMDIVEGTGQVQRVIIARQLVNLPRA